MNVYEEGQMTPEEIAKLPYRRNVGIMLANADGKVTDVSTDEIDDILPQRIRDAALAHARSIYRPENHLRGVLDVYHSLYSSSNRNR